VYNEKKIVTIKSFTSLNIRLPHAVNGCGDFARSFIVQDGCVHSALIVAPPGRGKTTILRDLCKTLSSDKIINLLLVDERSEIASIYNGRAYYEVGLTTDVIFNTDKKYAFEYAVRSMRPDVIITDELISEEDCGSIIQAISSGVSVIASIHAGSAEELKTKPILKKLIESKLISRYICLSNSEIPGKYDSVYDENFNLLEKLC
jgi:stage III sporulation protein AA